MNALGFATIASMKHGVPVKDIFAPTRQARIVAARRDAWRLARAAGWTFPEIGRAFNRDHSTIIQGLRDHAEN